MIEATNETLRERRKSEKEWLEMIRGGDLNAALLAIQKAEARYDAMAHVFREWRCSISEMGKQLNAWVAAVKMDKAQHRAALSQFEKFNKAAQILMGDTVRTYVDGSSYIEAKDIADIGNDSYFAETLKRIAEASYYEAMKITKESYDALAEAIGRTEAKLAKLEAVTLANGSTDNEDRTSKHQKDKLTVIKQALVHRRKIMAEQNLIARREVLKVVEKLTISTKTNRDLTDKEREILKGL